MIVDWRGRRSPTPAIAPLDVDAELQKTVGWLGLDPRQQGASQRGALRDPVPTAA